MVIERWGRIWYCILWVRKFEAAMLWEGSMCTWRLDVGWGSGRGFGKGFACIWRTDEQCIESWSVDLDGEFSGI